MAAKLADAVSEIDALAPFRLVGLNLLRNTGFELGGTVWTTTDPAVFRITDH
jgi:hypothetical protein